MIDLSSCDIAGVSVNLALTFVLVISIVFYVRMSLDYKGYSDLYNAKLDYLEALIKRAEAKVERMEAKHEVEVR